MRTSFASGAAGRPGDAWQKPSIFVSSRRSSLRESAHGATGPETCCNRPGGSRATRRKLGLPPILPASVHDHQAKRAAAGRSETRVSVRHPGPSCLGALGRRPELSGRPGQHSRAAPNLPEHLRWPAAEALSPNRFRVRASVSCVPGPRLLWTRRARLGDWRRDARFASRMRASEYGTARAPAGRPQQVRRRRRLRRSLDQREPLCVVLAGGCALLGVAE
jgi:hypothetical protein